MTLRFLRAALLWIWKKVVGAGERRVSVAVLVTLKGFLCRLVQGLLPLPLKKVVLEPTVIFIFVIWTCSVLFIINVNFIEALPIYLVFTGSGQ